METVELLDAIVEGFLFDIERRHRRGLCELVIKDDLRQVFLEKGCLLSASALVETTTKGKAWRVVDGDKIYVLTQVRDFIRVSQDMLLNGTELAKVLNVTPGAIARLRTGSLKLSKAMADAMVANLWVSDWLANEIMLCAAKDALSAIADRKDKAVAVLIRREFAGYPNVVKWLVKETDWEEENGLDKD